MNERNEITFEEFYPSKDQARLLEKMKDQIQSGIAKLQNEMNYHVESMTPQEKFDWTIKNGEKVNAGLLQICLDLCLSEEYLDTLRWFFYTGSDFYLSLSDTAPYDFAIRADFSNCPYPSVHELYLWLPETERNQPQLLQHDLDFLVRGNLKTLTVEGWRQLGNWITKLKEQFDAGKYYGVVRGRPHGTTTQQANEKALEMYKIYLKVRQTYKGKERKPRSKGRSRWSSIYDEVRFEYEKFHRLPVESIKISSVKYLVGKGKKIYDDCEANKGQENSAELT